MSCFLKYYSVLCQVLEAISIYVANSTIRILGIIILNTII
jgi:hypothetical protein